MGSNKIKITIGKVVFEAESDSTEFLTKERENFFETIPSIMINTPVVMYDKQNEEDNEKNVENELLLEEGNVSTKSNLSAFIREKSFFYDTELTLGTIYYCQEYEKMQAVSTNDIKEKLKSFRQKIPGNISQCFSNLANKGYIQIENKKEKTYYITEYGKDFINNYEKKDISKKSAKNTKVNKKKNYNIRYTFATREEVNASNYPNFLDFKNKEKIMLLMYILLEEKNIVYTEICELMEIMNNVFNIVLSHDTFKDTFRNNPKYFHKKNSDNNKKAKEFKLVEEGIVYVKENILQKKEG